MTIPYIIVRLVSILQLLNALHKGIAVRILTNDYGTPDCSDMISPLPFLVLNGAEACLRMAVVCDVVFERMLQVKWYATTTFDHQKYMMVCVSYDVASIEYMQSMHNRWMVSACRLALSTLTRRHILRTERPGMGAVIILRASP